MKNILINDEERLPATPKVLDVWQSSDVKGARRELKKAQELQHQYDKLAQTFDNILLSYTWLRTQDILENAYLFIGFAETCTPYLLETGGSLKALEWCQRAITASNMLQQNPHRLYFLQGKAQNALGLWSEAKQSFEDAIQLSSKTEPNIHAQAILTYGRLLFNQGRYDIALKILRDAEQLLLEQDDIVHLADVRSEIAAYYMNKRELDKALAMYLEVESLLNKAHNTVLHVYNPFMLGIVYRKMKNYQEARRYLEKFLELAIQQKSPNTTATASHHLAWVYLEQNDIKKALGFCSDAIEKYKETGDKRGESDAYEQLGRIYLAQNNIQDALTQLNVSLQMRKQLGNRQGIATSHSQLFRAYFRRTNIIYGLWHLCAAIIIYWRIGMLSRQRMMLIIQEILPFWK